MGPTGPEFSVLQLHPSLRCNLRCQHCYSSSSPEEAGELSLDLLRLTLDIAAREGINVMSVSGGEPLMLRNLNDILRHARSLRMTTAITTNGLLLTERRLAELHDGLDLMAISLDGLPESHNRLRGQPRAFELMHERLETVRRSQIPFGFIFTLTLHNLNELAQIAEYAVAQGAGLLQIHPLEEVGRAGRELARSAPDALELSYAYLEVARLHRLYGDRLRIQFDAVDVEVVRSQPGSLFAHDEMPVTPAAIEAPLADLVSPLVLEPDGWLVPIQYGFGRGYAIGHVAGDLSDQIAIWKRDRYPAFRSLCRRVYNQLDEIAQPELPMVNWYGLITQASQERLAVAQAHSV